MEAVGEHRSASSKHTVHGSRHARSDRFHSAGEIVLAHGLDDEVHVVVLNRVVRESEAPAVARRSEAALKLSHERDGS